jgi:hypothetical protein
MLALCKVEGTEGGIALRELAVPRPVRARSA